MVNPLIGFDTRPKVPEESISERQQNLAILAASSAGVAASGFISTSTGRVWDKYLSTIRAVEAGSPGGVLRTFRTSEFLSPLESWSTVSAYPADIRSGVYGKHLKASFGQAKGYSLTRTGSIFGEVRDTNGKLLGMGLNIEAGTQKGAAIADFYARIQGVQLSQYESLNDAILRNRWKQSKSPLPYSEWIDRIEPHLRRQRLIIGSRLREKVRVLGKDIALSEGMAKNVARAETTGKLLRAKAASTASRLNILLRSPLEIPGIGKYVEKIPGMRSLAVKPGTALQFLGRYTGKAMLAGAVWKGIEYTDYLRSEGSPWAAALSTAGGAGLGAILGRQAGMKFSTTGLAIGAAAGLVAGVAPRFDEGILSGVVSVGTDISVARAKLSRGLGFTETLREQEQITPGLISMKTALGFGGVGALASGLASYSSFAGVSIAESIKTGKPLAQVFEHMREKGPGKVLDKMWSSRIGQKMLKTPGLKHLAKIKNPMALGFTAGIAAYGITALGLSTLSGRPSALLAGILGTTDSPEELEAIYSGEKEVAVRKGRWWEFGRSTGYEGGRIEYFRPHFAARLRTRAYQKGLYGDEQEKWDYDPMLHPLKAMFGSDEWKYHYEEKYKYERPAPMTGTYGDEIPFIGPLIASTFGKLFKPRKEIRPEEWKRPGGGYVHRLDTRGEEKISKALGGIGPGDPVDPDSPATLINELNYRRREAVGLVGFMEGAITKKVIGREEFLPNQKTLGVMGKETGAEYWLWKHLNIGGGAGTTEAIRRFIPRTRSYLDTYNPLRNTMPSWMPDDYFIDLKHGNPFDKIPEAEIRLPGAGYAALHRDVAGLSPEEYPLAHRVKILGDIAMYSNEYRSAMSEAKRNLKNMSSAEKQLVLETERQVREKKQRRTFVDYKFQEEQLQQYNVTVSDIISPTQFRTKEFGDMIIEIPGMGETKDEAAAMEFAKRNLLGQNITIQTPSLESRRYSKSKAGPVMKAAAVLDGKTYSSMAAEAGVARAEKAQDEFQQLDFSFRERLAGGIWEKITHSIETPLEYLTPVSPASKLIRHRSPIEEYIATEAVGTGASFWDKPLENFIIPAIDMAKYKLGFTDIPEQVQERRDIQEYFDMLKWVKSSRIEAKAREVGDRDTAKEFKKRKESTVFGVDVFQSPAKVMRALPRREKDFFNEFLNAKTEKDRKQILELIPDNEKRLYHSQWMRQKEQAAYAKRDAKIATEQDNDIIATTAKMRAGEGYDYSPDMRKQWEQETRGNQDFDEWLREQKAAEYFDTHSLPGADWLGWHPSVDLEDVKLKYVENAGLDFHDFDLWEKRKRSLANKPYINNQLISQMENDVEYNTYSNVAQNSKALSKMFSQYKAEITQSQLGGSLGKDKYNVQIYDGRKELIDKAIKGVGA